MKYCDNSITSQRRAHVNAYRADINATVINVIETLSLDVESTDPIQKEIQSYGA